MNGVDLVISAAIANTGRLADERRLKSLPVPS